MTVVDDLSMGVKANLATVADQIEFHEHDVCDHEFMHSILDEDFDYIYYLAAIASVADSSEVEQYTDYDKQRLYVTPGCTGLWQATERNDVGFEDMVKLDLEYIKRSSLSFDFKIIFQTIKIILNPNNSY